MPCQIGHKYGVKKGQGDEDGSLNGIRMDEE